MTTQLIPTYEALALQLKALGIECVFGLMSDETATLLAAIDAVGIRYVRARHENNAVAMAEGYASSSGQLGVVILGRGPATANGLHGMMYAQKAGSRVLLLLGASVTTGTDPNALGPDYKAMDQVAVLRGASLRHMTIDHADDAPKQLVRAAAAAHQGLMTLLLPTNILTSETPAFAVDESPPKPPRLRIPAPRNTALHAAARTLKNSQRILILAGAGAHYAGARDAIIDLADHLGAALATTMKAKDMFRGHPFDCGVVGSLSHGAGRRLFAEADCVLVFGAGLNQRTTSHGLALPDSAAVIHIDSSRAAIGRWFPCDVGVVGDAKVVATMLRELMEEPLEKPLRAETFRRALAEYKPEEDFQAKPTARLLDPRTAAIVLNGLLPENRNVVYDAGNFLQCAPYLSVPGPAHIKQASDFSSIGMGFGTALGFAMGAPDPTTVLVIGDGAFMMTISELETTAREGIPLVIILMNDAAYGAELHHLKLRSQPYATSQFPDIDFAPVAECFGFEAATVRTVEDLQLLESLLKDPQGPIFIDCKINGIIAAGFMEDLAPKR